MTDIFRSPDDERAVTWGRGIAAALKAKYDPTNVFRLNHNIPPRP